MPFSCRKRLKCSRFGSTANSARIEIRYGKIYPENKTCPLEKTFSRDPVENEGGPQRVIATERCTSSDEKRYSFILATGGVRRAMGYWLRAWYRC